jgi:hypothetical protein
MTLMSLRSLSSLLILISACALFAGCDDRPKRVPVAGTIYIDGKPVPKAQIRVIPDSGRSAQAQTDEQGRFRLYTFDYEKFDGAILGEHPVEIKAAETVAGGTRYLIPKKYFHVASSGVTIKVEKPVDDLRIDLTWDGGAPFVEASENQGDAPPVGAVPVEPEK